MSLPLSPVSGFVDLWHLHTQQCRYNHDSQYGSLPCARTSSSVPHTLTALVVPSLRLFSRWGTCALRGHIWGVGPQSLYLFSDSTSWEACPVTSMLSLDFSSAKGTGSRIEWRVQCGDTRDTHNFTLWQEGSPQQHLLWRDFIYPCHGHTTWKPPLAGSTWAHRTLAERA